MALLDLSLPRTSRSSLFGFAVRAFETRRQRSALARLDDEALADIGLSRMDALEEAGKSFWDVPETWRC